MADVVEAAGCVAVTVIQTDVITYNAAMDGATSNDHWQAMLRMLAAMQSQWILPMAEMQSQWILPIVITYNAAISACANFCIFLPGGVALSASIS